jgi:colanic acid/amylovoran biosynthesis glycosyltransferase
LDLMDRADIFLQHSITDPVTGDEEGLPVAILEAMAHSLPVISTIHAGIPEAVLEGTTGFLVRERDTEGMAERIIATAADPDLKNELGENAWRRARDFFSAEREIESLRKIIWAGPWPK